MSFCHVPQQQVEVKPQMAPSEVVTTAIDVGRRGEPDRSTGRSSLVVRIHNHNAAGEVKRCDTVQQEKALCGLNATRLLQPWWPGRGLGCGMAEMGWASMDAGLPAEKCKTPLETPLCGRACFLHVTACVQSAVVSNRLLNAG